MNAVANNQQDAPKESDAIKIRHLRSDDIATVQGIDRKITKRATSWDSVDIYLAGEPLLSFVAECQGEVVGFLLGDVKSYEFGLPQSGWVETVGVDQTHQRRGIGRLLVQAFLDHCRRTGISNVQALIRQDDKDLRAFFASLGFRTGELVNMETALK